MGLYLVIFDGQNEIGGVEVDDYSDFALFRNTVLDRLEANGLGTRVPTRMLHSDCSGEWTPDESRKLTAELEEIAAGCKELPPAEFAPGWQKSVAKARGIEPRNLYECFFDPAGKPLVDRLISLARLSSERHLPILFR
jgi:hypothetical protein